MPDDLNDFIRNRIRREIEAGELPGSVTTRFPPEPNGQLHIGHSKSICLNFGIAEEFDGETYLRFDDTNPLAEDTTFVDQIKEDVAWLGFDPMDRVTFASDYFEELFGFAEVLIKNDKAFVCDLSQDEIRNTRGTLTEAGTESPYRVRSVDENLDLLRRMRAGEFPNGSRVLRAKIDMSSPNMNMRDPVLYRILNVAHHRTGDSWCIYPTYDFTHCICDALERITHSLCTLEFEDHRPLYDWVLDNIGINFHPPQIEFSRLSMEHTVMSKRMLSRLVEEKRVDGWDDPRLPTIAGLRRRGVPASAIRDFARRIGVTKQENLIQTELLDYCVRQALESSVPRGMAILDPLKVVITNFEGEDEVLSAAWHPKEQSLGDRYLTFGREIYIDRCDFEEEPPRKYRRLSPGALVRLRYAYIIRCDEVVKDATGEIAELHCTYVPESKSGEDTSGLKPKGVMQFVSAKNATTMEVHLYDHLFHAVKPDLSDFEGAISNNSLITKHGLMEKAILADGIEQLQFERIGYFTKDANSTSSKPVFNRTVSLSSRYKPNQT